MWIDSHCHLNHARNEGILPSDIVKQARESNVSGMMNISCQIRGDFVQVLETAQTHDTVWCTIGTHPHNAGEQSEQDVSLETLIEMAQSDPNIIGIGESGLDYFYDYAPVDAQHKSFRKHIRASLETGLPLVIHARDADKDIIKLLREEGGEQAKNGRMRGIMHCFSSGADMAKHALELGFHISFSGIVTFKNAHDLRKICANVPTDRLLIETDAPFLAPVPYRGKMNTPAYVPHTGRVVGEVHGLGEEEIAKVTRDNFYDLFKLK